MREVEVALRENMFPQWNISGVKELTLLAKRYCKRLQSQPFDRCEFTCMERSKMDFTTLTLREYAADVTRGSASPSLPRSEQQRTTMRRCRTREQGAALLTVGHAIEYLVQSRLLEQETIGDAEREAMAILLNANLSVYNDGAEIVPLVDRLRRWFHGSNNMTPKAA